VQVLRNLVIPAVLAVLVGLGLLYWQAPPVSKVKVGDLAPDLGLPSHGGGPVSLANLRGRVVVLTAFRADCVDCAAQVKSLEELHRLYLPYGLAVIGLALDRDGPAAEAFRGRQGVTFLVLDDPDGHRLTPTLGRLQLPQSYVIDASGRVVELHRGLVDWRVPAARERIRKLLIQSGRKVP
jgi:peroxiredoxin